MKSITLDRGNARAPMLVKLIKLHPNKDRSVPIINLHVGISVAHVMAWPFPYLFYSVSVRQADFLIKLTTFILPLILFISKVRAVSVFLWSV